MYDCVCVCVCVCVWVIFSFIENNTVYFYLLYRIKNIYYSLNRDYTDICCLCFHFNKEHMVN